MARVFYTGAYKPPREFNWVVGVILLFLTLGPVVHRLPAAVGPARDLGGHGRARRSPATPPSSRSRRTSCCSGGVVVGPETLLRWYVLHVLALPFVLVIFLAVHFWRIRKDGGISGPL